MAGAGIVYAQFALDGKLVLKLGEVIRKSMQPNKQWFDCGAKWFEMKEIALLKSSRKALRDGTMIE